MKTMNRILATAIAAAGLLGTALPAYAKLTAADAARLGATRVNLSNEFGLALQAGFDLPLNDKGLGFSLDAKRYFVGTTASFFAGNTLALQTEHKLDPWVISGGLSYRF